MFCMLEGRNTIQTPPLVPVITGLVITGLVITGLVITGLVTTGLVTTDDKRGSHKLSLFE